MTDVREVAFEALLLADESAHNRMATGEILERYSYLDRQSRSFLKRLIEGTIERRITIDHVLDLYSSIPVIKMKKQVRCALRMGVYQILYMEGIPDHAAVGETVRLIKKTKLANLSGFVNAVLRSVVRNRDNIGWPDPERDRAEYLSVFYSCPKWIVQKLIDEAGEENAISLLELSVSRRPVMARVNTSKTSVSNVLKEARFAPSEILECAVKVTDAADITDSEAFGNGDIFIQDISSMLVGIAAGIGEEDTVLDLCAAPGGKSLHAADIATKGHVIACDVSENKIGLIRENIHRCGFSNIETRINDATVYDANLCGVADVVIADVPCSGLGVMGRKNDIKYNVSAESIASLVRLQQDILVNAARYVKPGGTLMFCTCTCSQAENADNVKFLTGECGLECVDFYDRIPSDLQSETAREGYIQLYGKGGLTDGFFIAKLRKHE